MAAWGNRVFAQIQAIARRETERVLRLTLMPRMGNIVEWDPKTHRAKVEIQPEGKISNWIPTMSPWIGNGWGLVASHSVGDQVMVMFPEYGSNQGVILGRLFDERNPPPQVNANVILVNSKGSWIALKDGKLGLNGVAEIDLNSPTMKMTATGTITVTGQTVNINGSQGDVVVNGVSLVNHTHGGVTAGSDSTAIPNKAATS